MNRGGVKPMKKTSKKNVGRGTGRKKVRKEERGKKSRTKAKAAVRRKAGKKKAVPRRRSREQGYALDTLVGLEKEPKAPSGLQSGNLQGLSSDELVDSQSVDELLEEGNAFEAGVVSGVEESEDSGTREVRTREVPVDDVPEEYLDPD